MSGLDSMTKKRDEARAKRQASMPAPMFKPRETPVEIAADAHESAHDEIVAPEAGEGGPHGDHDRQRAEEQARQAEDAQRQSATEARQAAEAATQRKVSEEKQRKAKEPVGVDEPADIQIPAYITKSQDEFIQDVLRDGRYVKPRITSQTAVIRYALRRLMEQQSAEQVIKAMQRHAAEVASTKTGPGRPRG